MLTYNESFTRLEKKLDTIISFIEANHEPKGKWLTPAEAMQVIGCKKTKLKNLRLDGTLEFRYNGPERGVMISRKSVEAFIKSKCTVLKIA